MLSVKSSIGGFTSPYVYTIPADTIIFYNATYSAAVEGWDTYTDAVGKFILGTATQIEIAQVTAASGSSVATAGTLSTAGAHFGATVNSVGGAGTYDRSQVTAGDHIHTASPATITTATEMKPLSTTITVLRTSTSKQFFPANTIHINETNLVSGTQKLSTTSPRYISGGTSVSDVAATTHSASFTVSLISSGAHEHMPLGSGYQTGATGGGATTSRYLSASSTTHNHVMVASASLVNLKGKLLKLWIAASRQLPKNATVVMYCGNLSLLPTYWKVCDGTNGTINMQTFFVGHGSSGSYSHGDAYGTAPAYALTAPTVASDNFAHAHYSLNTSDLSFLYRPHGQGNFAHVHALTGASMTCNALPANIKLAFIQLVI